MLNTLAPIVADAISIAVRGNTDKSGSMHFNNRLAGKRALTIYNKLISLGVDPKRISILPRDTRINERSVTIEMRFH